MQRPLQLPNLVWRSQAHANLPALAPLTSPLNQGPFPPPALPDFSGTTGLSATPNGPACPSRAAGWCPHTTAWGFPCCGGSPCMHAAASTPAGPSGCARCSLPQRRRPSPAEHRVGSRIAVFEACSAFHSRFSLHTRGVALRPFSPEASEISLPTSCSGCFRLEQHLSGGTLTHWRSAPFHGAHSAISQNRLGIRICDIYHRRQRRGAA